MRYELVSQKDRRELFRTVGKHRESPGHEPALPAGCPVLLYHGRGDGNIVDIKVEGCILAEMREMLAAIAPWVQEGSYLSMFSDDGSRWRWSFQDGKCQEIPAELHWPSAMELSTVPKEREQVIILVKEEKVTDVLSSDQRVDVEVLDFDIADEQELDSLSRQWDAYRKNYFPIY